MGKCRIPKKFLKLYIPNKHQLGDFDLKRKIEEAFAFPIYPEIDHFLQYFVAKTLKNGNFENLRYPFLIHDIRHQIRKKNHPGSQY